MSLLAGMRKPPGRHMATLTISRDERKRMTVMVGVTEEELTLEQARN